MTTPKFKITTDGDLLVNKDIINETPNFKGSKDDLIDYLNCRVEAMTTHIQMLEDDFNAMYSQMHDCACNLTVAD